MSNVAEIVKQEQDRRAGADDAAMRRRVRRAIDDADRLFKEFKEAQATVTRLEGELAAAQTALDLAKAGDPSKLPEDPGEPGVVRVRDQRDSILDMLQRSREESDKGAPIFWGDAFGRPDPAPYRRRGIMPMLASNEGTLVAIG